jgi:flagellar biosynthesis/type III secretory pathway protein FliH
MTIDERLDALAQSMELLASFHRDTEAVLREHAARMDKMNERMDKMNERMDKMNERMDKQLMEIIAPIARMVLAGC